LAGSNTDRRKAPTAVAERDRFIIAVSGVIGITNITQTI
jgi:hypothetical protein